MPVAEAEWAMLTLLLASDSSTSTRFLLPRVVRTLRLDEARDTVTRDEGLGDNFNLKKKSIDKVNTREVLMLREVKPVSREVTGGNHLAK